MISFKKPSFKKPPSLTEILYSLWTLWVLLFSFQLIYWDTELFKHAVSFLPVSVNGAYLRGGINSLYTQIRRKLRTKNWDFIGAKAKVHTEIILISKKLIIFY